MSKTVLVVGATGLLGGPVVRQLQADGFAVRVMARNMEKARRLFDESVDVVAGDATDADAVALALGGCDGVHISIEGDQELLGVQTIAAAAAGQRLERLTYISGTTVREENRWFPMVERKLRAEQAIRDSGVPYAVFCPTWFFEMLARFVRGGRAFLLGKLSTPYHFLSVDDLARMVSRAYQREEAAHQRFYVHGPQAIPVRTALERYLAALHPDITSITTLPLWLARLTAVISGNEERKSGAVLMAYFEKVGEPGDPGEANRLLGAPMTTLDDWLAQKKTASNT